MEFHGLGGNPETGGHSLVLQSIGNELEHLPFARGERFDECSVRRFRRQEYTGVSIGCRQSSGSDRRCLAHTKDVVRKLQAKPMSERSWADQHDTHEIKDAVRGADVSDS